MDELRPPNPVDVPLWVALFFKKRDTCRMIPPDWLEPGAPDALASARTHRPRACAQTRARMPERHHDARPGASNAWRPLEASD